MLNTIIELIKFFGGLSGLASSAFIIYDRVYRYRPSVFLIPVEYKTSVRFKNVTAETIIIYEVAIIPAMLQLARANDLMTVNQERAAAMYQAADDKVPKGAFIVIKPMEERTFALHRFADFENANGKTAIAIRCRWRNTRKPFPFNRYVEIKTTVQEIRDLREASLAGKA